VKEWIKIALRNTVRQKKRSIMLGGAIAFGFFIITLLNAFTSGLAVSVEENFSGILGGHIFISGEEVSDRGSKEFNEEIAEIVRRSRMSGDLIFGPKSTMTMISGIDYSEETDFFSNLEFTEGSPIDAMKHGSVILPVKTAEKLNVQIGESLLYNTTTVTGQKNVGEFVLRGLFKGQESFGMSSGYAAIEDVNELIGLPKEGFTNYNMYLFDIELMDRTADALYAAVAGKAPVSPRENEGEDQRPGERGTMGGMFQNLSLPKAEEPWEDTKYTLVTLNEMMSQVTTMISTLKTVSFSVFLILLLIIMVGILNTFRMVLIERTNEIGTMRSIGVQKQGIMSIFLWEAGIIGFIGALTGFILAVIGILILGNISLTGVPALTFFLREGKLFFSLVPFEVIGTMVLVAALSVLSALLPARAAAKLKPVDALRAEY